MKKRLCFIAICMVIGLKHEIYAGPISSSIAVNRYFQAKQILAGNIDKLNEPLNDYGLALMPAMAIFLKMMNWQSISKTLVGTPLHIPM